MIDLSKSFYEVYTRDNKPKMSLEFQYCQLRKFSFTINTNTLKDMFFAELGKKYFKNTFTFCFIIRALYIASVTLFLFQNKR